LRSRFRSVLQTARINVLRADIRLPVRERGAV
jgi:hypothetical protein